MGGWRRHRSRRRVLDCCTGEHCLCVSVSLGNEKKALREEIININRDVSKILLAAFWTVTFSFSSYFARINWVRDISTDVGDGKSVAALSVDR